jgi:hypothetical protein
MKNFSNRGAKFSMWSDTKQFGQVFQFLLRLALVFIITGEGNKFRRGKSIFFQKRRASWWGSFPSEDPR